MCGCVLMSVHAHVFMHMEVNVQCLLNLSLPYGLRQNLSQSLKLPDVACKAVRWALAIVTCLCSAGITDSCNHARRFPVSRAAGHPPQSPVCGAVRITLSDGDPVVCLRGHSNWLFVLACLQGPSQSLDSGSALHCPEEALILTVQSHPYPGPLVSTPFPVSFPLHRQSSLSHLTLLPGEFLSLHKLLQKSVLCGLLLIIQRGDSSLLSWHISVFVLMTFLNMPGILCEPWCLLCT